MSFLTPVSLFAAAKTKRPVSVLILSRTACGSIEPVASGDRKVIRVPFFSIFLRVLYTEACSIFEEMM